jgi:hypothetical protein
LALAAHRVLGLVLGLVLLYVSISGIILNHPELISEVDAPLWMLPGHMRLVNWNRGSVLAALDEGSTTLLGGKLGVLAYDARSGLLSDFGAGLPRSLYRGKVNLLARYDGHIYAGTVSGLFRLDRRWRRVGDVAEEVVALVDTGRAAYVVGTSHAYRLEGEDLVPVSFTREGPEVDRIPLVSYVFDLHAGRVLGLPGKLLADVGGIALVVLALTGLYMWVFPKKVRLTGPRGKRLARSVYRYHMRHFHRLGALLLLPLLGLPLTGLFMQPPFLIAVARGSTRALAHVSPPEPGGWNGSVDRVLYDPETEAIYVIAGASMYRGPSDFSRPFEKLESVVPVHPMGATVFEKTTAGSYLLGSFAGFLTWEGEGTPYRDLETGEVISRPVVRIPRDGFQVNGLIEVAGRSGVLDFHDGLIDVATGEPLLPMPEQFARWSVFSLWHYMFEVHNGRIWRGLIGPFYILHTMVVSLCTLTLLWTGLHLALFGRRRGRRRGSRRTGTRRAEAMSR